MVINILKHCISNNLTWLVPKGLRSFVRQTVEIAVTSTSEKRSEDFKIWKLNNSVKALAKQQHTPAIADHIKASTQYKMGSCSRFRKKWLPLQNKRNLVYTGTLPIRYYFSQTHISCCFCCILMLRHTKSQITCNALLQNVNHHLVCYFSYET